MYVLKSATVSDRYAEDGAHHDDVPAREALRNGTSEQPQTVIYLDPRAFTRDCVGNWLRSSLSGFQVRVLQDPAELEGIQGVDERIRAVIINTGPERVSSASLPTLLSAVGEVLPETPVALLSDFEDPQSIREAFALGVRGYIPTSLASMVAVEAIRLICVAARLHRRSRCCAKAAIRRVQRRTRRSRASRSGNRRFWTACNVAWRTS